MVPFSIAAYMVVGMIGACLGSSIQESLSQSYAPVFVGCPADMQWIRPPTGLNQLEAEWVQARKRVVTCALNEYLEQLNMEDFDVTEYICQLHQSNYSYVPTLGLAISGGGWASAFTGTGALRALDSRLQAANEQRTGGLLQSMTYFSGLSGGSFPPMSFSVNNFPTADEIVDIWRPEISRTSYTGNTTQYAANATSLFEDVLAKAEAGFEVGAADYFGRAWSYEFVTGDPDGGVAVTFSSVVNQSKFIDHQMPFPIIHGLQIQPDDQEYFGLQVPYTNATIFDMTPFEFGAWNGSVQGFTPMEWLGTRLNNGSPMNTSACVRGFDRAGFIIGTSGAGFNFWYIEDMSNNTLAPFSKRSSYVRSSNTKFSLSKRATFSAAELDSLLEAFQEYAHENASDIGYAYYPNPFAGLPSSSPSSKSTTNLKLVDASEDGQAIPFWGQIQPARSSSFIIGWDDNEDGDNNWNNGTNLYNTYLAAKASGIPFPVIPSASTFVNRNYTNHPVFFGCNANLTTTQDTRAPIILYLANSPYSAYTNYSYTQSATTREQMSDIFVNSFNIVTQANGTLDAEWPVCLGCAAIDRSLSKMGWQRTGQCEACFSRYCWDGVEVDAKTGPIDLTLLLDPELGFLEWNETNPF
ncbi:MAG: hypothetical protein M1827_004197 [Pycnora praestabilis]|nr:MAG: hypothetical protein M1827_004197 [Pycnora praestabilis]